MEMLKGISLDLKEENLNRLKEIFPEVFQEGKIDFEKLRLLLGDNVEDKEERYEFTWNGKRDAIRIAQTPSTGTLRPDKESSKNWDDTENLYIEGDNLEVLKLLQKSYFGKVKMIYIDPPYNTGNDFIYPDNFKDNIANYKEITNQSTKANPETNGRYHTDWLNMMYPRLKLARNLLREDGVIFISIDDHEIENLKRLCNEIFGEENFISNLVIETGDVFGPKAAHIEKTFVKVKDYALVYAKNSININNKQPLYDTMTELYDPHYNTIITKNNEKFTFIEYLKNIGWIVELFENFKLQISLANISYLMNLDERFKNFINNDISDILYQDAPFTQNINKELKDKYEKGKIYNYNNLLIFKTKSGSLRHYKSFKDSLHNTDDYKSVYCRSSARGDLWKGFHYDMRNVSSEGDIEFKNGKKPVRLIKQFIKWFNIDEGLILDFFSGSATTAHSIMKINNEESKNIKFIMVQIPTIIDDNIEFKTICDLGKERIRRAGDKIVSENKDKEGIEKLDIGFKVFKLDSSNLKSWDSSIDDLENNLLSMETNIKNDRSNEDLLYEILLKSGIGLTAKIEEIKVGYNTLYNIGCGALLVCLDDKITQDVIDEIPKHKSPYMETKVIFKEAGFMSDAAKINAIQNLKQFQIEDVRSV